MEDLSVAKFFIGEREPKFYEKNLINFDYLEDFLKSSNEELKNKFCDILYKLCKNTFSDYVKKLYAIVIKYIVNDYFVDTCIKIINDEDSSYISWYAKESLVEINSEYALNKSIENNLFDEYINSLFVKNLEKSYVFDYALNKIKNDSSFGVARAMILVKMKEYMNIKKNREKINDAFKYILKTSTNYNKAYPAKNTPGYFLKMTKEYKYEPEIKEMYDIALNFNNIEFKCLAQELIDEIDNLNTIVLKNKYDTMLKVGFESEKIDYYYILKIYNHHYENESTILSESINKYVTKNILIKILNELKESYNLIRNKYIPYNGSLTPFGLADTTWQPYYKILLVIGMLGRYKNDNEDLLLIINELTLLMKKENGDDKYAINSIIYDISLNKSLNEEVKNIINKNFKLEKENSLYIRHTLHSDENILYKYFSEEMESLINNYKNKNNNKLKKAYAYELNKYVNTSYCWMKSLYQKNIKEAKIIVNEELNKLH